MKNIIGILSAILLAVIVLIVGSLLYKSCIKKETVSFNYSVQFNGEEYKDGDTVKLHFGDNVIKPIRPLTDIGQVSVSIHRNPDKDFDFQADGKIMGYAGIDDMTNAFDIKQSGEDFILNISDGTNMQTILQKLYPENIISNVPEIVLVNDSYFYVQISFANKQMTFPLTLGALVTEIVIDPPSIVF